MGERDATIESTVPGAPRDTRPAILILTYGDLARDPRVERQIRWLRDCCRVVAAGYAPPNAIGATFLDIRPPPPPLAAQGDRFSPLARAKAHGTRALGSLRFRLARVPILRAVYRKARGALQGLLPARVSAALLPEPATQFLAEPFALSPDERHLRYQREKLSAMTNLSAFADVSPDLLLANDLDCLALAEQIFPGIPTIFDAHEYAPLEYNDGEHWLNFEQPSRIALCKRLLPGVAAMSTVCQGIADEYARNFAVGAPIEVVTNAPFHESITPRRTGRPIRIVHHGIAAPIRRIETMAEAVRLLDEGLELHLILVEGSRDYIEELRAAYRDEPRIHFIDPVPMPEISRHISQFDIGLFILEPAIFNYRHALPNKFFEFVQARLAIAVGPSPEMERMVREHGLGVVAPDFSAGAMAQTLRGLTEADIDCFKANSDRAASKLSAEANRTTMLRMVDRALAAAGPARTA